MISFSQLVKNELLQNDMMLTNKEEDKIKLLAVILAIGHIELTSENIILEIKSSNIKLIREILKKLKDRYPDFHEQVLVRENKKFKKNNKIYLIKIIHKTKEILKDLGLITNEKITFFFKLNIPEYVFKDNKNHKNFLKYFFIATGSINNPNLQKQYHLEITSSNIEMIETGQNLGKKYDINFKITKRKNLYALYLNKGEEIADFLKLIGSLELMFEFEEKRLLRDIRATENRLINAEIANDTKKQVSSKKQLTAIKKIKKLNKYDTLKPKTKEIIKYREDNPEASLNELVEISHKTISKSNFNYHLNLIIKLAEEIK